MEGCFCPDGHTLFNSYTDVCVPTCRKHHLWPGPLTQPCGASGWDILAWPGLLQCQTTCQTGPAPTPFCQRQCGLEPCQVPCSVTPVEFSRGFYSQWEDRGFDWGWGVAKAEKTCPYGLCYQAVNPTTPGDPLFPSLSACVGPDGFPKFVSGSAPSWPPLLKQKEGGRTPTLGWPRDGAGVGHPGVHHAPVTQAAPELVATGGGRGLPWPS